MKQEELCAECEKFGTGRSLRCGHFLHIKCYNELSHNKCPKCKTGISKCFDIESLFFKIKSSNLHIFEVEQLNNFLEKLSEISSEYPKPKIISYDEALIEKMQRLGWDINNKKLGGPYLFYRACMTDDLDKVNLLIEHGLIIETFGSFGLNCACSYSSFNVFERLIHMGVKVTIGIIFDLLSKGMYEMISRVLKEGEEINCFKEKGERPIHAAAKTGSIKMVRFLIENGADFSAIDNEGDSILHYALNSDSQNNLDLIEYLLESGFDFGVKNTKDWTPLMLAIQEGNWSIAKYLIEKKAAINIPDKYGNSPLHVVVSKDRLELINALICSGADLNAKDNKGWTPFHCVPIFYSDDLNAIIRLFLDNGADINALDKKGKSPFYYLYAKMNKELKRKAVENGADLTIKNEKGESILDLLLK